MYNKTGYDQHPHNSHQHNGTWKKCKPFKLFAMAMQHCGSNPGLWARCHALNELHSPGTTCFKAWKNVPTNLGHHVQPGYPSEFRRMKAWREKHQLKDSWTLTQHGRRGLKEFYTSKRKGENQSREDGEQISLETRVKHHQPNQFFTPRAQEDSVWYSMAQYLLLLKDS